jgi:DNA-binding NtrC family response regulator
MSSTTRSGRILLIDDAASFVVAETEWLRAEGYQVIPAQSAEDAEKALARESSDIDLALVDMFMDTDQEGGLKLIHLISETYPWIVSIVVTGHADIQNAATCMEAGAFSYIVKGSSIELKRQIISRATDRRHLPSRALREGKMLVLSLRKQLHEVEELIQRIVDEYSSPGSS